MFNLRRRRRVVSFSSLDHSALAHSVPDIDAVLLGLTSASISAPEGSQLKDYVHFQVLSARGPCNQESGKRINVTFVDKDGDETHIKVPIGMSMLEAAHENDIDLEGACEGSLACSTCHVIVMDMEQYNKLPDPTDEENDMLDLAFGLTETSRLGCQVIAKPELEGLRSLSNSVRHANFAVDGFKPKPH
ncbi:hypothetical protein DH2020_025635 [Rehmannia glutinosa]|uniref:2Fe-2S ferredoxin n=1 Tax=Rehmannia glutinosa TaxID=99300 RepID=A0ABR0W342_REHGL